MKYINFPLQIKPIRATFEITNICNLKCIHCYFYSKYNHHQKIKHKGLTFSQIKKLIKKLGNEGIFELAIGGGEPFCFSRILEILRLATSKMFVTVSTNGLLLNEKIIMFLKNLPNFCLQISLDGKEKTHRRIRNISSYHFHYLIEIIRKCVINGIDLKIGFMLSKLNINELNYICEFCLKEKIKKLTILPYIGQSKELQLNFRDFYKAAKILRKYYNKLQISIRDPFLHFLVFKKRAYCEAGILTFNIDYRGNVSPCCYINNSDIGNIFNLKIRDIPLICEERVMKKIKNRNLCMANNIYKLMKFNLPYNK